MEPPERTDAVRWLRGTLVVVGLALLGTLIGLVSTLVIAVVEVVSA